MVYWVDTLNLDGLNAIKHSLDMHYGYPKLGVDAKTGQIVPGGLGETITYADIDNHPTQNGRYKMVILDQDASYVNGLILSAQNNVVNGSADSNDVNIAALPNLISALDDSWSASG